MGSTPTTQLRCDLRVIYAGAGAVLILVAVLAADVVGAQAGDKYTARLGWVPTAGPNDRVNVTGKGTAKAGQSAPWVLEEATDADVKVGTDYLASGIAKPASNEAPF